jgi:glycosyltransferase involved in cell wall biosynthesis
MEFFNFSKMVLKKYKMKIVFFSNSFWSIYNFRRNLILNLIKKKNKVVVLGPKDNFSVKLKKMGCETVVFSFKNNRIGLFSEIGTLFRLFFALKKIKPDILLNFTIKPLIYGSYISGLLRIRTINLITGLGTNFVKFDILSKFILFLFKISFKKVAHVFFQNNDDLNLFLKNKIIIKKKYSIVAGSGVDVNYFNYKKLKFTKKIKFIMVSRMLHEKGVIEFIEAGKKLLKEKYNCKFQLIGPVIANNSSSFSKKELNDIIPNRYFKYIGNVEDVRRYIENSDCVVLPSYREGTPRSLLEALSMGRPIITTDAIGCKNIVKSGYNGIRCKTRNIESLCNAMKKYMILEHKERIVMSLNARVFVEKKYKDSFVINKFLKKIYEKNK